ARSTLNGCSRSHAAAPGWLVVSTTNELGSSRRHSSQSIVWIPPTLGGKSFVTKRWTAPLIGPRRASAAPHAPRDRDLRRRRTGGRPAPAGGQPTPRGRAA